MPNSSSRFLRINPSGGSEVKSIDPYEAMGQFANSIMESPVALNIFYAPHEDEDSFWSVLQGVYGADYIERVTQNERLEEKGIRINKHVVRYPIDRIPIKFREREVVPNQEYYGAQTVLMGSQGQVDLCKIVEDAKKLQALTGGNYIVRFWTLDNPVDDHRLNRSMRTIYGKLKELGIRTPPHFMSVDHHPFGEQDVKRLNCLADIFLSENPEHVDTNPFAWTINCSALSTTVLNTVMMSEWLNNLQRLSSYIDPSEIMVGMDSLISEIYKAVYSDVGFPAYGKEVSEMSLEETTHLRGPDLDRPPPVIEELKRFFYHNPLLAPVLGIDESYYGLGRRFFQNKLSSSGLLKAFLKFRPNDFLSIPSLRLIDSVRQQYVGMEDGINKSFEMAIRRIYSFVGDEVIDDRIADGVLPAADFHLHQKTLPSQFRNGLLEQRIRSGDPTLLEDPDFTKLSTDFREHVVSDIRDSLENRAIGEQGFSCSFFAPSSSALQTLQYVIDPNSKYTRENYGGQVPVRVARQQCRTPMMNMKEEPLMGIFPKGVFGDKVDLLVMLAGDKYSFGRRFMESLSQRYPYVDVGYNGSIGGGSLTISTADYDQLCANGPSYMLKQIEDGMTAA